MPTPVYPARLRQPHGGRAQRGVDVGVELRRRRLLDHLLVAPLYAAVAQAERQRSAAASAAICTSTWRAFAHHRLEEHACRRRTRCAASALARANASASVRPSVRPDECRARRRPRAP